MSHSRLTGIGLSSLLLACTSFSDTPDSPPPTGAAGLSGASGQAGTPSAGSGGASEGGRGGTGPAGAGQGGLSGGGGGSTSGASQGGAGQGGKAGGDAGVSGTSGGSGGGQGVGGATGGAPSGGQAGQGGAGEPTCPFPTKSGAFAPGDVLDFLVQDVCVDAQGKVTADDPATCACRRDLALDETLPYHKVDGPDGNNPFGFQISDAYPVRLAGGAVGAVHTFDFGFGEVAGQHLRSFFEFDAVGGFGAARPSDGMPIDGYDLVELKGSRISYVTTCDAGGGVQPIWGWKDDVQGACQLEDSWLLFDREGVSSSPTSAIAHLRINAPSHTCPQDALVPSYTEWQQRDVTYTTGKTLSTIVSSHYGGSSPETADHIERFYLTREYGKARWERWNLTPPPFPVACNGEQQEIHGGQTFHLVDCRDWTHVFADPRGGFEPRLWPIDLRAGRGNLVINGDFGAGLDYLGPWEKSSDSVLRSIIEANDPLKHDHRNRHLAISWNGQGLPSVYQDIANPSLPEGTLVTFGARLWADGQSQFAIKVFQLDAMGQPLSDREVKYAVSSTPQRVSDSFQVVPGVDKFRIEFYLGLANLVHRVDDVWLTPQ